MVRFRVRGKVRVEPVLGEDPTKIWCSDHPFVFCRPQVRTYLRACKASGRVGDEEEGEEEGNEGG